MLSRRDSGSLGGLSVTITTLHGVADASVGRAFVSRRQTRLAAVGRWGARRASTNPREVGRSRAAPCASRTTSRGSRFSQDYIVGIMPLARETLRIGSSPLCADGSAFDSSAVGADETLRLHSNTQVFFIISIIDCL